MTELRINGFSQVRESLETLLPYLRFKHQQARMLIKTCKKLEQKTIRSMSKRELRTIVTLLLQIQNENYASKRRRASEDLHKILGLTP